LQRLATAGVGSRVTPVHVEAHNLPFADEQFDAIISIDAYHYFGTADLYLAEMKRLLTPGGWLGIVVPGLREEQTTMPPAGLSSLWEWDFCSFHSPQWWSEHWAKTGLLTVSGAWWLGEGHQLWADWAQIVDDFAASQDREPFGREVALLQADREHLLGFTIAIATKSGPAP
jgi:cyclopropane fatty-acyl-phospholipid synthase-like methyltransferase